MSKRRKVTRAGALAVVAAIVGVMLALPAHAAGPGTVTFTDPNHDGYLNAAEMSSHTDGNGCATCIDANWAHTDASAASAVWSFLDNTNAVPAGGLCTGSGPIDANGYFNTSCASVMPDGVVTFKVEWFDGANVSLGAATATLTKDTVVPTATPSALTVPSVLGPNNENAVPVSGKAGDAADLVRVAISDGTNVASVVKTPAADKTFAGTIDAHTLTPGALTVTATDVDLAGNAGPALSQPATLDHTAPVAPTVTFAQSLITQANQAAFPVTVSIANEDGGTAALTLSDNATPTPHSVSGSGVIKNGSVVITLNASGLSETSNTIAIGAVAKVTDTVGNVGALSTAVAATKDTTGPAAPTITSPAAGDPQHQRYVIFSGNGGEIGGTVVISDATHTLATIPVPAQANNTNNAAGEWSQKLQFTSGTYHLTATPFDSHGNIGTPIAVPTFDVDATAPTVDITEPSNFTIFSPVVLPDAVPAGGGIPATEPFPAMVRGTAKDGGLPTSKVIAVKITVYDIRGVNINCFYSWAPHVCVPVDPQAPAVPVVRVGHSVIDQNATCATCKTITPSYDWSFDASNLQPGYYTLTAAAVDAAGNTSDQPVSINFVVL